MLLRPRSWHCQTDASQGFLYELIGQAVTKLAVKKDSRPFGSKATFLPIHVVIAALRATRDRFPAGANFEGL